jgi:flavin-dependent dehydrogenase
VSRSAEAAADAFHDDLAGRAKTFDVVVAGAGPAGSITARRLARAGLGVLMLDRLRPASIRLGEVLPGAARRLLAGEGLGELAAASHHAAVTGGLVVWGDDRPVASDALRDPYGAGVRLDRARFDAALRAASVAAGTFWSRTNARHLERVGDDWVISRDAGPAVRARIIIDATGRSARLLRLLGQSRSHGARLTALYQVARPENNAAMGRTLIEARPDGWLYAGKLSDGRWAIGYHTLPQDAVRLRACETQRATAIASAPYLSACLGALAWEGAVVSRDARGLAATVPSGPGWFAVGDAVLAFDPIAGQGLFNALRTGLAAAEAILATRTPDATAYVAELARVTAIYSERRQALYWAEERWPEQTFWRAQRAQTLA